MSEVKSLPGGWVQSVLQDVACIRDDLRVPVNADERAKRHGPYPYYGATGQVGWIDGHLMDGEYVLLGEDGAPFLDASKPKAYMISGKCWVNNHAHVLQAVEGLTTNRFLMHSLNVAKYDGIVNGTTRLKLTQAAMRTMPVSLPPISEQRRIVDAIEQQFSRLDAGVAALKRTQAALKRFRASVLKAAVEGRLTEAWRAAHSDAEPASRLLERILAERRAKWEADLRAKGKDPTKAKYVEPKEPDTVNLPTLPEGWCWATIGQVVARSEYGTSVKCSPEAQGVPVLRIPNIAAGEIDLSDMKYATQPLHVDEENALKPGDILVCRTNGSVSLIGKAALIRVALNPLHTFASYLLRFRLSESHVLPSWLHLFLSSPQGRAFIESHAASSAGQHNISLSLLHNMSVPLPPLAEQHQIVAEVEQRLSVVDTLEAAGEANLKRAERLRQSILERAFSGQLVPQDPQDEPASALLERIRRERGASNDARGNGRAERNGHRRRSLSVGEVGEVEEMVETVEKGVTQQRMLWREE